MKITLGRLSETIEAISGGARRKLTGTGTVPDQ